MNKNPFTSVLAMLLVITLVAPAAFFIAPQRASASAASCIGGLIGMALSALGTATNVPTLSKSSDMIGSQTAGVTTGTCINDVILIPLARTAIRAMLQSMTASVIGWINGANGTGQPSYVQNLPGHLQGVGDATALPFITQISTSLNSPFGAALSSSLMTRYGQGTSMAGFYAANQSTLAKSSPTYAPSFLKGDWSKGGLSTWFALTTQDQNNPYTLYHTLSSQADTNVSQAQTNRRQDLAQSGGFLSWCGASDASTSAVQTDPQMFINAYNFCISEGNSFEYCQNANAVAAGNGIAPHDPCTKKDGSAGMVQTPGSVIHDFTQKAVVDSGFDQLLSATDLDNALGAIVTAVFSQVLGTAGGLLGGSTPSSSSSGGRGTLTNQLNNYSASSVAATQASSQTAQDVLTRVASYTSSASAIAAAANTASTSVASLSSFCTSAAHTVATDASLSANANVAAFVAASLAQASAAQTAITTEIAPVLTQAQAAPSLVAPTQALARKVQAEASGTTGSAGASLAADVSALVLMPPSTIDVATAQANASVTGGAFAAPSGSLNVSGGLVDQMNLISANAQALKASVCTYKPPAFNFGG